MQWVFSFGIIFMVCQSSFAEISRQDAFNGLRLPVIWISDKQNPGVIDRGEIYVSPELLAINAYFREAGEPPISISKLIEKGLAWLKSDSHSSHGLLAKDLKTRSEPFSTFNLKEISDHKLQRAMAHLVSAIAMATPYYFYSINRQYFEQLRTVFQEGDALQIHHFWLKGGAGCINPGTSSDPAVCTLLDQEPLPNDFPQSLWWPGSWRQGDIDALRAQLDGREIVRAVFSPRSRIVKASEVKEGCDPTRQFNFQNEPYCVVSVLTDPRIQTMTNIMTRHLARARTILSKDRDDYATLIRVIETQLDDLRHSDIFANYHRDLVWINAIESQVSFTLWDAENYQMFGNPFGIKNMLMGIVGIKDANLTTFARGVIQSNETINAQLLDLWTQFNETPPFNPAPRPNPNVEVVSVVYAGGIGNSATYVLGGFNQPNSNRYSTEIPASDMKKKLALFGQIVKYRILNQGYPIAGVGFSEETADGVHQSTESMLAINVFVLAHEMSHSRGIDSKVQVRDSEQKQTTLQDHYIHSTDGQIAKYLEECKADLQGVWELAFYESKGFISSQTRKNATYVFFGNLLRNLLANQGKSAHGYGSSYTWKLFEDHGVIIETGGKLHFDLGALEREIPTIVKEINNIYGSGDRDRVIAFHDGARAGVGENTLIGKAVQEVEKLGIPGVDKPWYIVEGLPGTVY
jgi:hypothetical protein